MQAMKLPTDEASMGKTKVLRLTRAESTPRPAASSTWPTIERRGLSPVVASLQARSANWATVGIEAPYRFTRPARTIADADCFSDAVSARTFEERIATESDLPTFIGEDACRKPSRSSSGFRTSIA